MNTEDFLDILEQRDLVPAAALEGIREKIQLGKHRITAKSVLKFLVKRELITRRQAKQLLETTLTVATNAESSILGIITAKDLSAEPPAQQVSAEEEIPTLAPVEAPKTGTQESESGRAEPGGSTIGEEAAQEELGSFISDSISGIGSSSAGESFVGAATIEKGPEKKSKPRKKKKPKNKNEWDSPLLLLGGGGLVVLLVV